MKEDISWRIPKQVQKEKELFTNKETTVELEAVRMKQKIAKIHKKRKRNPFTGIAPLSDIYQEGFANKAEEDVKNTNKAAADISEEQLKAEASKKMDEETDAAMKKAGLDNDLIQDEWAAFNEFMDGFIYPYLDRTNETMDNLCAQATCLMTTNPDRQTISVIRNQVGIFASLVIATFATYNWFFLIYIRGLGMPLMASKKQEEYRSDMGGSVFQMYKTLLSEDYRADIYPTATPDIHAPQTGIAFQIEKSLSWVKFWFKYSIQFIGSVEWYIVHAFRWIGCEEETIPFVGPGLRSIPYLGSIFEMLSVKYAFVFIYATIFYFTLYNSITLKELFWTSIDTAYVNKDIERYDVCWIKPDKSGKPAPNSGQTMTKMVVAYVVFLYFMDFTIPTTGEKMKEIFKNYKETVTDVIPPSNILTTILWVFANMFYVLFYLVHFMVVIFIDVPLGIIGSLAYLTFCSYGSMILYSKGFMSEFNKIQEYIDEHSPDGLFTPCYPPTLWNKIFNFPNYVFNILYRGKCTTAFLIYFLYATLLYGKKASDKTMDKTVAIIMAVTCGLAFIVLLMVSGLWNKYDIINSIVNYYYNYNLFSTMTPKPIDVCTGSIG